MKVEFRTLLDKESRLAFWMLVPTFTVVIAFVIFPVIWNLWLSLKPVSLADLRGTALFKFNLSLENFQKVFSDPDFVSAILTTLIYTVAGSTLSIFLGLMAALLVHGEFRGRSLLRGLFIAPYIAPVVAVAFTWSFILDPQLGVLNWLAVDRGLLAQPIPFLSQRWWELDLMGVRVRLPLALTSVILFEGWRSFPFAFLFILARLQAIPDELYEAADIDGASPWRKFWMITWPMLRPVWFILILFGLIYNTYSFNIVIMMFGFGAGIPGEWGDLMMTNIFRNSFQLWNFGTGAATSVLLLIVMIIIVNVWFRYFKKTEELR